MTKKAAIFSLSFVGVMFIVSINKIHSSLNLNLTYIRLVRVLDDGSLSELDEVAEQLSSVVVQQPTGRRNWEEVLVWFHLGEYERAAQSLARIDSNDLMWPIWGTQPSLALLSFYPPENQGILDWLPTIVNRPPSEYLLLQGLLHGQDGQWEEALLFFREALVVAPQLYNEFFYRQYYFALAHSPDSIDQSISDTTMTLLASKSSNKPGSLVLSSDVLSNSLRYSVEAPAGDCGRLTSFDFNKDALERGPLVPMRLGWECSSKDNSISVCLYSGDSIVQSVLTINLIPNAGFEWTDAFDQDYPYGHERTIHTYDNLAHRFLTSTERGGAMTNVAGIRAKSPGNEASFVPAPIAVKPDVYYLQAGWVKSEGDRGQIGVWWRGSNIIDRLNHNFWGVGEQREGKTLARVIQAPSNASYVDAFIGYQQDPDPDYYFDDMLFMSLPESPCVQTHFGDSVSTGR